MDLFVRIYTISLIIANALLLAASLITMKRPADTARKIGFGIMNSIFALNVLTLIGGWLVWL